jgi:hypothetical protein
LRTLTSEIEIAAPVAGTVLEHTSTLPGRRPMQFRPTIVEAQPGRILAWDGRLFMPGLFDGHHCFELEGLPGRRTRLRQLERFRGVLIPFSRSTLRKTQEAFEIANRAINLRVESRPPAAGPGERSPGQATNGCVETPDDGQRYASGR